MSILSETNWDEVEEKGSGSDVPAGEYRVCVVKSKLGQSQSGKDRVSVEMKITDGAYQGRVLFRDYYLSAGALGMWKGACSALGGNPKDEASIVGKEGVAVVAARKDDGTQYAGRLEVKSIKAIAPSGVVAATSGKIPARKAF